ncbi:hypothetical protein BDW62DRAFT_90392 [Aspergillus aurantiobrunneus]
MAWGGLPPHHSTSHPRPHFESGAGGKARLLAPALARNRRTHLWCDERMRMNVFLRVRSLLKKAASAAISCSSSFLLQQASLVQAALIWSILCTGCTCLSFFASTLYFAFNLPPSILHQKIPRRAVLSDLCLPLSLLCRILPINQY